MGRRLRHCWQCDCCFAIPLPLSQRGPENMFQQSVQRHCSAVEWARQGAHRSLWLHFLGRITVVVQWDPWKEKAAENLHNWHCFSHVYTLSGGILYEDA